MMKGLPVSYSSKDYYVMAVLVLPFSFVLNLIYLRGSYFHTEGVFVTATLLSLIVISIYFMICGWWAVEIRNRFPGEEDVGKKLLFMIGSFLLASSLVLRLLFTLYEKIPFVNFRFDDDRFIWSYVCLGFVNIFLSFLFEGISRYEEWKVNLEQTQQLKRSFEHSQLLGLKRRVNPHFLFNSLTSLSTLIEEDDKEAEIFLDQLSKVYRYMLRNDVDEFVTLQTEIQFLKALLHLLNVRFGEGMKVSINVDPESLEKQIPPLSLQLLLDNAFSQNIVRKNNPLQIEIWSEGADFLFFKNSVNRRLTDEEAEHDFDLDHLVNKYRLIGRGEIEILETPSQRVVRIPLFNVVEHSSQ
ncbi:MAG: histidine kinase [Saprospiraceae bacterium]|nr:histidine kinase [Saprospiraceae bacterium]